MSLSVDRQPFDIYAELRRLPRNDEKAGQAQFAKFINSKFAILESLNGPIHEHVNPGTPAEDVLFMRFTDINSEFSIDWDDETLVSFGRVKTAFVAEAINRMSWIEQRTIIKYFWNGYQEFYCSEPNTVVLSDTEAEALRLITVKSGIAIDPDKRRFEFKPEGKALLSDEQILETYPEGTILPDMSYGEPLLYDEAIEYRKFEKAASFYRRIGEWIDAGFLYHGDKLALEKLKKLYDQHAEGIFYGGDAQPGLSLKYLRQVVDFYKEFETSEGINEHHKRLDELLFEAGYGGTITL